LPLLLSSPTLFFHFFQSPQRNVKLNSSDRLTFLSFFSSFGWQRVPCSVWIGDEKKVPTPSVHFLLSSPSLPRAPYESISETPLISFTIKQSLWIALIRPFSRARLPRWFAKKSNNSKNKPLEYPERGTRRPKPSVNDRPSCLLLKKNKS
jgi:hypothetical protein